MLQNIKKNLLLLTTSIIFTVLFSAKSFAISEINKNLYLSPNNSHLLTFDEKIINYKFDNDKNFNAEILSNIFNNRHELLIKPLKTLDNKLTVWTSSRIYTLNIEFEQNKKMDSSSLTDKEEPLNDYEIDKPPFLPEDTCGMADFELDNPPIKENREIK
jgi:hypothetical protein